MERDSVFQIGDTVVWNDNKFNYDDYPWYVGTFGTILNVEELPHPDTLDGAWITHRVDILCEDEKVERGLYPIRFDLHKHSTPTWEV